MKRIAAAILMVIPSAGLADKFDESQVYWDSYTSLFKEEIIVQVNRISDDNADCVDVDEYSIAKAPAKSLETGRDHIFFACRMESGLFENFFFPAEKSPPKISSNISQDSMGFATRSPIAYVGSSKWADLYGPLMFSTERITFSNGVTVKIEPVTIDPLFEVYKTKDGFGEFDLGPEYGKAKICPDADVYYVKLSRSQAIPASILVSFYSGHSNLNLDEPCLSLDYVAMPTMRNMSGF